jgi:glucuronokinase
MADGQALARAGLVGNPSDGYGGAVLAVTVPSLGARASARRAPGRAIDPRSELVGATLDRFAREFERPSAAGETAIEWSSTIPRGVGLGGSSAIVIAVLRALCGLYGVELAATELAELALAVEVEGLGIVAGLQDRVVQAYGGLMFMDFDPAAGPDRYEQLDPAQLPPVLVAWRADAGGESHAVHAPLRERHARGEAAVVAALDELGALARRGRDALLAGERLELARCVDSSFEQRRRMLSLDPRHVEMVECARFCGASANYAGSGGAIVAVCAGDAQRAHVAAELQALGCDVLAVTV